MSLFYREKNFAGIKRVIFQKVVHVRYHLGLVGFNDMVMDYHRNNEEALLRLCHYFSEQR